MIGLSCLIVNGLIRRCHACYPWLWINLVAQQCIFSWVVPKALRVPEGRMLILVSWHAFPWVVLCISFPSRTCSSISDLWMKWSWETTFIGFIVLNSLNLPFAERIGVHDLFYQKAWLENPWSSTNTAIYLIRQSYIKRKKKVLPFQIGKFTTITTP